MNIDKDDRARFEVKVDRTDDCHEWQSHRDRDGYGRFWLNGGHEQAHRVAYFIENGELPPVVRHDCDNPSCVNPDHLRGGTRLDNIRDRQARDRQAKGQRNGRAKLDEETVIELRRRKKKEDVTYRELAKEMGVSRAAVAEAVRGETWKHVPMPSGEPAAV